MEKYPSLIYPSDFISLRRQSEIDQIKDVIRNTWVDLTPEEWVRQHLLAFLVNSLGYPESTIAVEKKVEIQGMPKRFDALIFHQAQPAILIECKAPSVKLTEEVFHQACRYNTVLQAPMTVLSNGLKTIVAVIDLASGKVQFISEIPHKDSW